MTYILIVAIVSLIACIACFYTIGNNSHLPSCVEGILGISGGLSAIICIISLFVCLLCGYEWIASGYQANIINKEYGTDYSREEIFYGSNVIDKIQEIKRQRIEINGNLIAGE